MIRIATLSQKNAKDYEYVNSRPILKTIVDSIVLFFSIIFVLILVFNILTFILPRGSYVNFVSGQSMYPTLENGQMVFTSDDLPIRRGDIIMSIFPEKEIELHPDKVNKNIIKRIVGLPGDYVDILEDGSVYINGIELREPYLTEEAKPKTYIEDKIMHFELSEDEYMVLGDNRGNSNDSRYFGPIKAEDICYKQSTSPTKVTARKSFLLIAVMCLIWFVYSLIEFILTEITYYIITRLSGNKSQNKKGCSSIKAMFESPEQQMYRTKEYLRRMNIANNSDSDINKETLETENKTDVEIKKD